MTLRAGIAALLVLLFACAWRAAPEATTAPAPPVSPPAVTAASEPEAPRVGGTARRAAQRLVEAERTLRSDAPSGPELANAAHLQQRAYRKIVNRDWDSAVIRRVPRWMRFVVRRNLHAQRQLNDMSGSPPKTLPQWRIIAPEPRAELRAHYRRAQRRFGVRWEYLAAVNLVETRMGRIRGVSSAGARGPMQFIPPTWDIYGRGDIWDPHDAIMAAARYLDARGAPRDMDAALYAYNNDVRYVRAVRAYADVMRDEPRLYRGYYHWQVYYRQPGGAVWLPVGWDNTT